MQNGENLFSVLMEDTTRRRQGQSRPPHLFLLGFPDSLTLQFWIACTTSGLPVGQVSNDQSVVTGSTAAGSPGHLLETDSQAQVHWVKYSDVGLKSSDGGDTHEALAWVTALSLLSCLRVLRHRKVEQASQSKWQKLGLNLGRLTPRAHMLSIHGTSICSVQMLWKSYSHHKTHGGKWCLTVHRLAS